MGVLRHEVPDQQVLNFPIIANGQIAPLVTMSCRILLRRVASSGFLPRERFSPLAHLCRSATFALTESFGGRADSFCEAPGDRQGVESASLLR